MKLLLLQIGLCFFYSHCLFAQNGVVYASSDKLTHQEKMDCICNDPLVRDAFIPNNNTTIKYVRIRFIVMQNNFGATAVSSSEVQSAINNLNSKFQPYKIQFLNSFSIEFIQKQKYYRIGIGEQNDLKNAYPRNDNNILAIYIVREFTGNGVKYYAESTFPWQGFPAGRATTNLGGIVFETLTFLDYNNLVHEVGHALGLFHSFHGDGVRETKCATDPLDVENVGTNNDIRGDFCSDTDPFTYTKPLEKVCSDNEINDTKKSKATLTDCNGATIPLTAKNNHMSYTSPSCRTQFTPQQAGRMHCFLSHYSIQGWLNDCVYDLPLLNQTTTQNQIYSVSNKIEAGPNFIISNGTDIEFQAGNKIILKPGFVAEAGSHFVAQIAPCPPQRLNENSDGPLYDDALDEYADITSEENNLISFATITPNPATGKFTIQLATANWQLASGQKPAASIEIYNTLGEKVYSTSIINHQQSTIDISIHPKGIYFIKIQSGDNIYTEKVVMQ